MGPELHRPKGRKSCRFEESSDLFSGLSPTPVWVQMPKQQTIRHPASSHDPQTLPEEGYHGNQRDADGGEDSLVLVTLDRTSARFVFLLTSLAIG